MNIDITGILVLVALVCTPAVILMIVAKIADRFLEFPPE